jgi:membrane protein YdbS with pleckstrin-like domain
MSKIDEKKEFIGLLKTYLSLLLAIILAVGAGISKLYIANHINILFWIGVSLIFICAILFILIAKKTHNEIKLLKDL